MNKKLILLSTVISLALPLNPVNAAVKAGAKCTTVGVKSVVGNKTFTCIKSGKKFVWNKGMIVTPGSTPSSKIEFVPWSSDLNQEILLSESNRQFLKWVSEDHGNVITPTFRIDPKLEGVDISWIRNSLNLAVRAFGSDSPENYTVIVAKDCQWIRTIGLAPCTDSSGNQYFSDSISKGFFVLQAVSEKAKLRPSDLQTPAHEYFHTVQAKISEGANWPSRAPSWFIEGGAYFVGISFSDLAEASTYLQSRNEEVLQRDYQNKNYLPLEKYTYINFIVGSNYDNPYGIGCIATEYIIASVGVEKYLNIYRFLGQGKDFSTSFESAVGLPLLDFYAKFELIRGKVGMPNGK